MRKLCTDAEAKELHGYLCRVQARQQFYAGSNNYYVVQHEASCKWVLCQRIICGVKTVVHCALCMENSITADIEKVNDWSPIEKKMCIHAKLCSILFRPEGSDVTNANEDFIEVMKNKIPNQEVMVALVHPKDRTAAGVVVLNTKTNRPKCDTCSGSKCTHINLYRKKTQQQLEQPRRQRKRKREPEEEIKCNTTSPLKTERIPSSKIKKSKNSLNPFDFSGKDANVFKVATNYPPSAEDKIKINRINSSPQLFKNSLLIPKGETCQCGNKFSKPSLANIEGTNIHIHHGREIEDSRNASLTMLFLTTKECSCRLFYTGAEDKLIRVSGINENTRNINEAIHFVSLDLLFEYHETEQSGGLTQFAFLEAKNELNCMIRGYRMKIERKVFAIRQGLRDLPS